MKPFKSLCVLVLMGACLLVGAQPLSTTGTKVILVVDRNSGHMTDLVLFNLFERLKPQELKKYYGNSHFYMGRFKGSYLEENKGIKALPGAELTIFTERQYHPKEKPFEVVGTELSNQIRVGSATGRPISNKKGELIVTIE